MGVGAGSRAGCVEVQVADGAEDTRRCIMQDRCCEGARGGQWSRGVGVRHEEVCGGTEGLSERVLKPCVPGDIRSLRRRMGVGG